MDNGSENSPYEKAVLVSAEILKDKKLFSNCWLTRHGSLSDRKGIDLVVELRGGIAVFIQIIAGGGSKIHSNCSNLDHGSIKKHFSKHPNIKSVIVVPRRLLKNSKTNSDIYGRIAEELRNIVNKAVKELKAI